MTNFQNSFALIKRTPFLNGASSTYSFDKQLIDSRSLVVILLLIVFFNFESASLAQGAGPPSNTSSRIAALQQQIANPGTAAGPPAPTNTATAQRIATLQQQVANSGGSGSSGSAATPSTNTSQRIGALQQQIANPGASTVPTPSPPTSSTNLATEAAENNDATSFGWLASLLNWWNGDTSNPQSNSITQGIQNFWNTTGEAWFTHVGSLIKQYIKQVVNFIIKPIVQQLTNVLVQYAYNPDVSVGEDGFSKNVQDLAGWVRNLSNDLLLLFFILSIWRYWANAAWKAGSLMGAIGRIVVAASATTAWPTIYHYVILISNSLTQYLLNQNVLNAETISNAVAGAISEIATGGAAFGFVNSLLSSGQINPGTIIAVPVVAVAQLLLVAAIGLAIISSLIVFFTMKVIQIIIVVAAFVFGPFFLCFLVSPDTSSTPSSFIRGFVETSLWTFVWTIF